MIRVLLWDLDGTLVTWTSPLLIPYVAWLHVRALGARWGYLATLRHVGGAYRAMLSNRSELPNSRLFLGELSRRLGVGEEEAEAAELELVGEGMEQLAGWIRAIEPGRELFQELSGAGRYRMVAATNPTMPQLFNVKRLGWAGFEPEAFELVTGTETSSRLKSSPRFYEELLERLGAAPEECLMIGNDGKKDLPAARLGIPVFLLENGFQRNMRAHPELRPAEQGSYLDLKAFLERDS